VFTTNVPNAGAIDEALLRPGRCFAAVNVRRLTREEGGRLALRLCDGDVARAARVLEGAMATDVRSVSAAEVYQAWRQEAACRASQPMPTRVRLSA
jgi:hypothetical protein